MALVLSLARRVRAPSLLLPAGPDADGCITGEQDGFYRNLLGLAPAGLPFNTASAKDFAFNAIVQNFVSGSCASVDLLTNPTFGSTKKFSTFGTLANITDLADGHSDIMHAKFIGTPPQFTSSHATNELITSAFCVTYLNQANVPVTVDTSLTQSNNGQTTFVRRDRPCAQEIQLTFIPNSQTAPFPALSNDFSGLVIAVVTKTAGSQSDCAKNQLADVDKVAVGDGMI